LEPVILSKEASIDEILSYFMGKNTPERQDFIIDNLRVEKDLEEEIAKDKESSSDIEKAS
jgi:topoisomerase-4 subunit B